MKKFILLTLTTILLCAACQKQEKRYTQQSPEIDSYKSVIDAYEKRDWQALATHYADSAKIMNNVLESEGQTVAEYIAMNKEDEALFSSWNYVTDQSEFEMTITDDGKTYVNFWGVWNGTLAANNKTYTIPAQISTQFVDGKIVKEYGYWDISKITTDLQAMANAASLITAQE